MNTDFAESITLSLFQNTYGIRSCKFVDIKKFPHSITVYCAVLQSMVYEQRTKIFAVLAGTGLVALMTRFIYMDITNRNASKKAISRKVKRKYSSPTYKYQVCKYISMSPDPKSVSTEDKSTMTITEIDISPPPVVLFENFRTHFVDNPNALLPTSPMSQNSAIGFGEFVDVKIEESDEDDPSTENTIEQNI